MAYADYAFYKDVYLGNVATEEEFPRIAERASEIIDILTYNRITNELMSSDETLANKIKKANCALAEQIHYEETAISNNSNGNISSIKAGEETITYKQSNSSSYLEQKEQYMSALTNISKYLIGTNLLYLGFRR